MIVNSSNQNQWLNAHSAWANSGFYPECLAFALVEVVHHLEDLERDAESRPYQLTIDEDSDDNYIRGIQLTGPTGFMHAVAGVELGCALSKAGVEFMSSDWQLQLCWPAKDDGMVLKLEVM